MVDNYKIIDSKKYMWDGEEYDSVHAAQEKIHKYIMDGFKTELLENDRKYFVYTRRVVTEIVVNGEAI